MSRRLVSLFSGIGGIDLGFERAGFEIVAHVEKDANCRKLLQGQWPNAVALDDVRTAGRHNLPECDLITFGFPCQDLSVAGKRAGLAGHRSGLFYEATRIIHELKPAYNLFENVPGLLSSGRGGDFERVLREMDRLGYSGAWRVLDAQWLGVAQRRRRVFGLFARIDSGAERCAEILSLPESLRGHPPPGRKAGPVAADGAQGIAGERGVCAFLDRATFNQGRNAKYLSEARYPADTASALVARGPHAVGVAGPHCGSAPEPPTIPQTINTLTCRMQGSSGWAPYNETEHLIPVRANAGLAVRRLTPTECERLQGFPDGWTAGFSDTVRYRMLGNAVCVDVAEWIAKRLAAAMDAQDAAERTT